MENRSFQKDNLTVHIFPTRSEMGRQAAADIAAALRKLLAEKEEVNVMFAAAPSQSDVHSALISEEGIDWKRVNAFHMDEYVGLDASHPAGFRNFLKRALFDILPFKSINLINGNADDPEEEAERYSHLLDSCHMDICVMGIGENGHIAFNDPGVADFNDSKLVKVVELDEVCRQQQVNDKCFENLCEVPRKALTVTVPGLVRADTLFCIVPASTKARAVRRTLTEDISEECPATVMRRHSHAVLYLDAASSELLTETDAVSV